MKVVVTEYSDHFGIVADGERIDGDNDKLEKCANAIVESVCSRGESASIELMISNLLDEFFYYRSSRGVQPDGSHGPFEYEV